MATLAAPLAFCCGIGALEWNEPVQQTLKLYAPLVLSIYRQERWTGQASTEQKQSSSSEVFGFVSWVQR